MALEKLLYAHSLHEDPELKDLYTQYSQKVEVSGVWPLLVLSAACGNGTRVQCALVPATRQAGPR